MKNNYEQDRHMALYYRDFQAYLNDIQRARAALEHLGMSIDVDDEPSFNGLVGFPIPKGK